MALFEWPHSHGVIFVNGGWLTYACFRRGGWKEKKAQSTYVIHWPCYLGWDFSKLSI